jgi:hypothetical protein
VDFSVQLLLPSTALGVLLGNKCRDLAVKGKEEKKITVFKLKDHKMSVIRDCLFNRSAVNATRRVWFLHQESEDAPYRIVTSNSHNIYKKITQYE